MSKRTLGDDIEDHFYGSQGVYTGSVANQVGLDQYAASKSAAGPSRVSNQNGEGCLLILGLFVLGLSLMPYIYSSTVVFSYWRGTYSQSFGEICLYVVVSGAIIGLLSRFVGLWAGLVAGFIALLPALHSIAYDTGYWWIIFRDTRLEGDSVFRFISVTAAAGGNTLLAYAARSKGHRSSIRVRIANAGRARRLIFGTLLAGLGVLILAVAIAVAHVGSWHAPVPV